MGSFNLQNFLKYAKFNRISMADFSGYREPYTWYRIQDLLDGKAPAWNNLVKMVPNYQHVLDGILREIRNRQDRMMQRYGFEIPNTKDYRPYVELDKLHYNYIAVGRYGIYHVSIGSYMAPEDQWRDLQKMMLNEGEECINNQIQKILSKELETRTKDREQAVRLQQAKGSVSPKDVKSVLTPREKIGNTKICDIARNIKTDRNCGSSFFVHRYQPADLNVVKQAVLSYLFTCFPQYMGAMDENGALNPDGLTPADLQMEIKQGNVDPAEQAQEAPQASQVQEAPQAEGEKEVSRGGRKALSKIMYVETLDPDSPEYKEKMVDENGNSKQFLKRSKQYLNPKGMIKLFEAIRKNKTSPIITECLDALNKNSKFLKESTDKNGNIVRVVDSVGLFKFLSKSKIVREEGSKVGKKDYINLKEYPTLLNYAKNGYLLKTGFDTIGQTLNQILRNNNYDLNAALNSEVEKNNPNSANRVVMDGIIRAAYESTIKKRNLFTKAGQDVNDLSTDELAKIIGENQQDGAVIGEMVFKHIFETQKRLTDLAKNGTDEEKVEAERQLKNMTQIPNLLEIKENKGAIGQQQPGPNKVLPSMWGDLNIKIDILTQVMKLMKSKGLANKETYVLDQGDYVMIGMELHKEREQSLKTRKGQGIWTDELVASRWKGIENDRHNKQGGMLSYSELLNQYQQIHGVYSDNRDTGGFSGFPDMKSAVIEAQKYFRGQKNEIVPGSDKVVFPGIDPKNRASMEDISDTQHFIMTEENITAEEIKQLRIKAGIVAEPGCALVTNKKMPVFDKDGNPVMMTGNKKHMQKMRVMPVTLIDMTYSRPVANDANVAQDSEFVGQDVLDTRKNVDHDFLTRYDEIASKNSVHAIIKAVTGEEVFEKDSIAQEDEEKKLIEQGINPAEADEVAEDADGVPGVDENGIPGVEETETEEIVKPGDELAQDVVEEINPEVVPNAPNVPVDQNAQDQEAIPGVDDFAVNEILPEQNPNNPLVNNVQLNNQQNNQDDQDIEDEEKKLKASNIKSVKQSSALLSTLNSLIKIAKELDDEGKIDDSEEVHKVIRKYINKLD